MADRDDISELLGLGVLEVVEEALEPLDDVELEPLRDFLPCPEFDRDEGRVDEDCESRLSISCSDAWAEVEFSQVGVSRYVGKRNI